MSLSSILQPKRPLDEVIAREGTNAFNLIRLVAASTVIFGHSFVLSTNIGQAVDPAKTVTEHYLSGTLAVMVFFLVSGIFVSQSLDRDRNLLNFAARRVFRIWPGLLVCLFISAALAAVFNSLTWPELWAQRDAFYRYIAKGPLLHFDWTLPGAFGDRAISTVNGSIWSLVLEVRMYILLAALATLGLAFRRGLVTPTVLFLTALVLVKPEAFEAWIPPVRHAIVPCLYFLAGIVVYAYRRNIRVSWVHVLAALVLFAVTTGFIREAALQAFIIAGTLWVGASRTLADIRLPADYSYGIYLYGFPVQQVVATVWPEAGPYLMTAISIPAVAAFAVLSWHLVELPGLAAGRGLTSLFRGGALPSSFPVVARGIAAPALIVLATFIAL